jgi:hypothetical protein
LNRAEEKGAKGNRIEEEEHGDALRQKHIAAV